MDDKPERPCGLLSPVFDWPEEQRIAVFADNEIDKALLRWSWPEKRTTLH
jgi:hypothetical protein